MNSFINAMSALIDYSNKTKKVEEKKLVDDNKVVVEAVKRPVIKKERTVIERKRPVIERKQGIIKRKFENVDDEERKELNALDVQDDIIVVIDPDKSADEIEAQKTDIQNIVDETEPGKLPNTDEYVGKKVQMCPLCGQSFTDDIYLVDGDACPVCNDVPQGGFVAVGEIQEDEQMEEESLEPIDEPKPADEGEKQVPKDDSFEIEESTMNRYLTRFVRENYKNAKQMKVERAVITRDKALKLECSILFNSGKKTKTTLRCENFRKFNGKKAKVSFRENRVFKAESINGKAPFVFLMAMKNNVMTCEGLEYNFRSKIVKENRVRRIQVSGKITNESFRPLKKK